MGDIACLIPVRNGERDLRLCLDSLAPLDPVVLALDDGSTDRTRRVLDGHPLVKRVLSNPRRDTYVGWDDAMNRTRLLEAAAEFSPRWIVQVDADEVLPQGDAERLKRFLDTEAVHDAAYGLRVLRMIGDMRNYDKKGFWAFRVFGFADGLTLPSARLHFTPVPTQIDRSRWVRTACRLMHRASLTDADRAARYAKYQAADPNREFQASYESLLDPPRPLKRVKPLREDEDFVLDREIFEQLAK